MMSIVSSWWKIIILIGAVAIGFATRIGWLKWNNDNYYEEIGEKYIEKQTGHDIDLTPATPERSRRR